MVPGYLVVGDFSTVMGFAAMHLIYIKVDSGAHVKQLKLQLELLSLFNKLRKIERSGSHFLVYTLIDNPDALHSLGLPSHHDIGYYHHEESRPTDLRTSVLDYYVAAGITPLPSEALLSQLPKKWSLYPPMLLLQPGTFDSPEWTHELAKIDSDGFWTHLLARNFPGFTHVAINKPIVESDIQRRPFNIFALHGDFGPQMPFEAEPTKQDLDLAFWCTVVQNGIHQTWAPRYTMFSRGNIKEKKRILDSYKKLDGQAVMDLYAGIGYFTLSYLKNGATVFCWELNPWSVEALVRGCRRNKFGVRVVHKGELFSKELYDELVSAGIRAFIFNESNETAPERMSQLAQPVSLAHVNLGLLPSSKPSWPLVVDLFTHHSTANTTVVHVHENCHVSEFEALKQEILASFPQSQFVHLERVKTFAPDVWHVVVDIKMTR